MTPDVLSDPMTSALAETRVGGGGNPDQVAPTAGIKAVEHLPVTIARKHLSNEPRAERERSSSIGGLPLGLQLLGFADGDAALLSWDVGCVEVSPLIGG